MVKIRDKDHRLAITIQENYLAGMKPKEIANLFKISKQRVNYWIHTPIKNKRKRRTKLTRNEINFIVKWARDKPIVEKKVSAKNIQIKFNKLSRRLKEKGINKKISLSTANRVLNKHVGKPRVIRKVFSLKPYERKLRLDFCKYMKEKNLEPKQIFFTDESIFPLHPYMNKGTNKIRLCKKTRRKLKAGNEKAIELVTRPHNKFNNGIMVSGGICNEGLGKIIFNSGNLNSFSYKQVLKFYREDLDMHPSKFFQQDGARAHCSKLAKNIIQKLFKEQYIPNWENGPKFKETFIPRWPPNSPDLSAIELVWSIIKQMLILFPPKDMDTLKSTIKMIWDSIPKEICENIIEHIKHRWDLCIKYRGRRLDKELLRKIPKVNKDFKWNLKNPTIDGIRVSYNDQFLLRLKRKHIREKTKELIGQKKLEKEAKKKYDKILKLKPKEYKQISEEEKRRIKMDYEYEKAKREVFEEDITKLEGMAALDYLSIISEETKQKLIGLCLDRELELNDEETRGDENEEMELEENEF